MTFDQWRRAFEPTSRGDDRRRAQLWNLDHETRIHATLDEFRDRIAKHFNDGLLTHDRDAAASAGLAAARKDTEPADSTWLGALPRGPWEGVRGPIYNFRSWVSLERYRTRAPSYGSALTTSLPPPVTFEFSLRVSGRFIWITWAPELLDLPDDPTILKRELGLPHFGEHDCVYRWDVSIEQSQALFVPTCLDAALHEAWQPPPRGHASPWGLTRDLSSGESRWPELLVEAKDYVGLRVRETRLGARTTSERIGPVAEDYMIGRL